MFALVHSPPAGSPERPPVAISPLRPQSSSPSRCPGQPGRPLSMVSPGPSLGPSPLSSPASRPLLPLSSPLSCLTPPNVSAALLNGEPASPLQPPLPGPSHAPTQGALAPKVEKVSHSLMDECNPKQRHIFSSHSLKSPQWNSRHKYLQSTFSKLDVSLFQSETTSL